MLGTKVYHFLAGSIPCALRAFETDPRIAARKVATFVAAKALDASDATRSAGAVAGRGPGDAGLTGSRCRLLRLGLRLWLRRCRRLLKLRLLNWAIPGERIVVNGNERVVFEIRLIVHRHQRVTRHDESPTVIADTFGRARDVTAPSRRGLGWV
jgi:hypothetical protein